MSSNTLWSHAFILSMIINFFICLSFQALTPTMPLYLDEMGLNARSIGLIVGAISVGSFVMRPFAGRMLDHFGKRLVFVASLLGVALMTQAFIMVYAVVALILIRFIHGLAWGVTNTGSNAIATSAIPRRHIGKGMSYFGLSNAMGQAIAPGVGMWIYTRAGYEMVNHASVLCLLVCMTLAFLYPYRQLQTPPPKPAAAEKKSKESMFERGAILPAVMMSCVTVVMVSVTSFVSLAAQEKGLSGIGPFFTFYAGAILLIRPFLGSIIDRYGVRATLFPALCCLIIGPTLLGFADSMPLLFLAGAFCGAGYGSSQTTLQTLAVTHATPDRYGAATATYYMGFDLGLIFGSVIAGVIAGFVGYSNMFHVIIVLPILAIGIALKTHAEK